MMHICTGITIAFDVILEVTRVRVRVRVSTNPNPTTYNVTHLSALFLYHPLQVGSHMLS